MLRRPPLSSTFTPTPLPQFHKLYLDLRIYLARTFFRILAFLQRLVFSPRHNPNSSVKRSGNPGFRVARISRGTYLKWGVRDVEARAMAYVREHTSIPVPRVYAFWSHKPASTSNKENDSRNGKEDIKKDGKEINYMLIEALPGDPIGEVWASMDDVSKERFKSEFTGYLKELRSLNQPEINIGGRERKGYISALPFDPLTDHRIATVPYGPFESVKEWIGCEYLLGYVERARPQEIYERLEKGLNVRGEEVEIVFTHSDLTPRNVLVERGTGRITGIVDWDSAGWCVEWWEGVKGVYGWTDSSFAHSTGDEERQASLIQTWRALLEEVVGDFAEELRADEEVRDIYGFPY